MQLTVGCMCQSTCCAAIGTFLIGLGIDLIIETQNGMSFALRFFFDRNNSHFLVRLTNIHLRANLLTKVLVIFSRYRRSYTKATVLP